MVNVAHGCAPETDPAVPGSIGRVDMRSSKAQHVELRVVETLRVIAASQHEDDEQADRERRGDGGAEDPRGCA